MSDNNKEGLGKQPPTPETLISKPFPLTAETIRPSVLKPAADLSALEAVRKELGMSGEEPGALTALSANEETKPKDLYQPPEKKSLKELMALSREPQKANQYFSAVLEQEYRENRLTKAQYSNFTKEVETFSFNQVIKDILITTAIDLGVGAGLAIGLPAVLGPEAILNFAQTLVAKKPGFLLSSLFPVSIAGIFRCPYLLYRSFQEIQKLRSQQNGKISFSQIGFFCVLNILNFFRTVGPLTPVLVSFPRNKDVGLAFINNQVQTGKPPKFIKRFTNWLVQGLFEKPNNKTNKLKPSFQPEPA